MAASTDKTNKPLIPRGVDDRPVDKYNRAKLYSGKALSFDGVNDYVESSEKITGITDALTIVGWVYSNTLSAANNRTFTQWDGSNGWFYQTNGGLGDIFFRVNTSAGNGDLITTTKPIKAGVWNFITCTYDGASMKFYLNSNLIESIAHSGTITESTTQKFRIGVNESISQDLDGSVAGVRIFNTALTAAQVAELYNNPEKIVPTGVSDSALKLWLPMMEGAGTTAYDGSPVGFVEDIVTGFTNGTIYPLDSFASSGDDITTAIKTSGFGGCVSNGHYYTNGQKVKVKFTYQKNSGNDLRVLFSNLVTGAGTAKSDIQYVSASGEFEHTFTMTADGIAYLQLGTGSASDSIDAVITDVYVSPNVSANHGTINGATWVQGVGAPVAQTAVIDWNKGSNLVTESENLDNWTKKNSIVVSASSDIAPDGSTNAYTLTDSSSDSYRYIQGADATLAGDYIGSVFIKKTTGSLSHYAGIGMGDVGSYLIVDTTNGTAVDSGSNFTDILVTSYNDDWWRVSAKSTINDTAWAIALWPALSVNGTTISTSGIGSNTFWGVQLEKVDEVSSYIPTHDTAQTSPVLLPQGLTSGRDITGVNLFENVRKQGALNLDGNSWAEVHDNASLDMTTNITAEAWVYWKQTTGSTDSGILSRYITAKRQFLLYHQNSTTLTFYTGATSSTYSSMTEGWHHIVGTYDGANRKLYVDGVLRATAAYSTAMESSDRVVEIGRYFYSGSYTTDDIVAQPRIYNRALTAEEVLNNYGTTEKELFDGTRLLDEYSGASAAYSLRLLDSTYTGPAVRVRRASDNAERDIYFSGGQLDTTTLESFASGTDAFVTTWYDQSGSGNHMTRTSAANQPKIVSNGVSLGYIEQASAIFLTSTLLMTQNSLYTYFGVVQSYEKAIYIPVVDAGNNSVGYAAVSQDGSSTIGANNFSEGNRYQNGSLIGATWGDMYSATSSFSAISAYVQKAGSPDAFLASGTSIGAYNQSRLKEVILYPNQTIDRSGVENNIITHYGF